MIGPAHAAMHAAAMPGHRFSVVTIARRLRAVFQTNAAVYGQTEQIASRRLIGIALAELGADPGRAMEALATEAQLAVEHDGAGNHIRLYRTVRKRPGGAQGAEGQKASTCR